MQKLETIADTLGGSIGLDNHWTFRAEQSVVDDCVTLGESEIKAATRLFFQTRRLMVKGSGAVGIAAPGGTGKVASRDPIACVQSGRNIAPGDFLGMVCQKGADQ